MTVIDRQTAIDQLRSDYRRVHELISEDVLHNAVPSCPEWDFEALVTHLARVYNFAGTIVVERLQGPPGPGDLPPQPDGMPVADYLTDRLERLVTALTEVPAEEPVWNFGPGPQVGSFWWRRQMHESIIHRIDAELAAGAPVAPVAPELASDTLSEVLMLLGFEVVDPVAQPEPDDGLSVHFHATDVPTPNSLDAWDEWFLTTEPKTMSREHAKATTAIRGTSLDLARWQWGRGGDLEVFGDAEAAEAWRKSIAR
ncbi:MAG TPA: maleylpyruvate isomerase family mycothiol-dependent enzyme [Acidimicrobiales bacterium]|nr:maleylpyruvate isomerase family mycothiol-dependent enzyme [Acidimicrobiales bacterium]